VAVARADTGIPDVWATLGAPAQADAVTIAGLHGGRT
jgi:hypothetical protein